MKSGGRSCKKCGVAKAISVKEKLSENRLRWSGQVTRRSRSIWESKVRLGESWARERGRLQQDLTTYSISEEMVMYSRLWRMRLER